MSSHISVYQSNKYFEAVFTQAKLSLTTKDENIFGYGLSFMSKQQALFLPIKLKTKNYAILFTKPDNIGATRHEGEEQHRNSDVGWIYWLMS